MVPVDGGSDPWTPIKFLHCLNQPVGLEAQSQNIKFPFRARTETLKKLNISVLSSAT